MAGLSGGGAPCGSKVRALSGSALGKDAVLMGGTAIDEDEETSGGRAVGSKSFGVRGASVEARSLLGSEPSWDLVASGGRALGSSACCVLIAADGSAQGSEDAERAVGSDACGGLLAPERADGNEAAHAAPSGRAVGREVADGVLEPGGRATGSEARRGWLAPGGRVRGRQAAAVGSEAGDELLAPPPGAQAVGSDAADGLLALGRAVGSEAIPGRAGSGGSALGNGAARGSCRSSAASSHRRFITSAHPSWPSSPAAKQPQAAHASANCENRG
jgi:hypothetical protein